MAQVRPDQLPRLHWQVPSRPGMQVPWPSQRAHGMQSGPKLLAAHSLQVGPLKPGWQVQLPVTPSKQTPLGVHSEHGVHSGPYRPGMQSAQAGPVRPGCTQSDVRSALTVPFTPGPDPAAGGDAFAKPLKGVSGRASHSLPFHAAMLDAAVSPAPSKVPPVKL